MCEQWKNSLIHEFNAHIVSCVRCLHRKLDQSENVTRTIKKNFEEMRKKKEKLLLEIKLSLPESECLEIRNELLGRCKELVRA